MITPWFRRRTQSRSRHRVKVPPSLERLEDRVTPAEIWVRFTGLSPVATINTPTLTWQASEGVIRYDLSIYRSSDLTVPVQSYAGLTGTSFTVPQPLSNDQYRVTITARDAANETYSDSRFLLVSHLAPVAHVIYVFNVGASISASTAVPPNLPYFGGLAAADWAVNYGAFGGGLLPDWNGLDIWYKAILSTPSVNARDRFPVLGAVYNTHGDLVAANYQQLWSGTLSNPVGYFENGAPVPPGTWVWTGTTYGGTWDSIGS